MSKILITGGGGFLGRNLIDFLLRKTGHGIVSINRTKNSFSIESRDRVRVVYHDLRQEIDKNTSFEIGEVDYIIHLAAATCTKKSFVDPGNFIMDNVIGTTNLLEYVRRHVRGLKSLFYLSSAEIYGQSSSETIFTETDAPNPSSLYAVTKICAQELCISYKNLFKIPVVVGYAMNSFGPHQSSEKFIPSMLKKIMKGKKVSIHLNVEGSTPCRRNYLHIDDLCDAIMFLAENGDSGEKYNIVAKEESDNLKLAKMISKLLGKNLNYELIEQRQNPLVHPRLSGEKLQRLGWQQKKTLEEGLKELIEWTKKEEIYDF